MKKYKPLTRLLFEHKVDKLFEIVDANMSKQKVKEEKQYDWNICDEFSQSDCSDNEQVLEPEIVFEESSQFEDQSTCSVDPAYFLDTLSTQEVIDVVSHFITNHMMKHYHDQYDLDPNYLSHINPLFQEFGEGQHFSRKRVFGNKEFGLPHFTVVSDFFEQIMLSMDLNEITFKTICILVLIYLERMIARTEDLNARESNKGANPDQPNDEDDMPFENTAATLKDLNEDEAQQTINKSSSLRQE